MPNSNNKYRTLVGVAYTQDKSKNSFTECYVISKRALVIFIGGAGDQESYYGTGPYRNINYAENEFQNEISHRINTKELEAKIRSKIDTEIYGYNYIYDESDINVIKQSASKYQLIYLIGHSLGGWNSAHLSRQLADANHTVKMLITLDPVGEGSLVQIFSKIHSEPELEPKSNIWINVIANPKSENSSDDIADFGEKWNIPNNYTTISETANVNHESAIGLFKSKLSLGQSALELLIEDLKKELKC